MFVNFSNEEDKMRAVKALDGYKLKGSTLKAFSANAARDPLLKYRDNNVEKKNQNDSNTKLEQYKPTNCTVCENRLGNLQILIST